MFILSTGTPIKRRRLISRKGTPGNTRMRTRSHTLMSLYRPPSPKFKCLSRWNAETQRGNARSLLGALYSRKMQSERTNLIVICWSSLVNISTLKRRSFCKNPAVTANVFRAKNASLPTRRKRLDVKVTLSQSNRCGRCAWFCRSSRALAIRERPRVFEFETKGNSLSTLSLFLVDE